MPTKHERISVVKDPELAAAIDAARRGPGAEHRPAAAVLRDLALQGAAAQKVDEERQRRLRFEFKRDVAFRRPTVRSGRACQHRRAHPPEVSAAAGVFVADKSAWERQGHASVSVASDQAVYENSDRA